MTQPIDETAHLRVSAHVLVQLGSELVTDVEQAILECVKNAYDADSPGCRIEIDTRAQASLTETSSYARIARYIESSENVSVELLDSDGMPLVQAPDSENAVISRKLTYLGRITIIDSGAGITADQIENAWLMISGSFKRSPTDGPKQVTPGGRTPLGDKGLGRLGTMKLGDILLVESATDPEQPIALAQFRWKDCYTATAVDEVPVHTEIKKNIGRLKGTRVSILGLNDLSEWRRKGRIHEIARSLAKLVSPFEVTSAFPVSVSLDGEEHSLLAVTNQVLTQAIAEFQFEWKLNEQGNRVLRATARFKRGLFAGSRSGSGRDKEAAVFGDDNGDGFLESLATFSRTKNYTRVLRPDSRWLVQFQKEYTWTDRMMSSNHAMADPGDFTGAFYFYHLDTVNQEAAAAGHAVDRQLIKDMAGISILRDGFQVRSKNDWLDLAAGMTSGSTYHMRVNNTIGYFALTGRDNFRLTEKSDREGFVEDATYRGFFSIAETCRKFANESLESVRRAFDAYANKKIAEKNPGGAPVDPASAVSQLGSTLQAIDKFKTNAGSAVSLVSDELNRLASQGGALAEEGTRRALKAANQAITEVAALHESVKQSAAVAALDALQHEREEHREQILALIESAAVGLSARGLAHELRTHLSEIRQRLTAIQKLSSKAGASEKDFKPHISAIRSACAAVAGAAALIDPMLPKSRALKDTFNVYEFVREYVVNRQSLFDNEDILVNISGLRTGLDVRVNRSRMLQVLDNLVGNSVYWLKRSRFVDSAKCAMLIEISVTDTGYSVSDSGPGIDPHYEDSLFEIFVTAKPDRDSGQGLGLFISRQLLAMDGCEISLRPERNSKGRLYKFDVNLTQVAIRG